MKNILGMLKLGAILAAFAATLCVMLAFVYAGTRPIVEQRERSDLEAALKESFPEADSFEAIEGMQSPDDSVAIESAHKAVNGGEIIGAVLSVSRAGYSGQIRMLVGVSLNGVITGVKIMSHSETPGLGANASSASYFVDRERRTTFYGQFAGKNISDPFEVRKDVEVITASTITSRAVALAVKAAGIAAIDWLAGIDAGAAAPAGVPEGDAE
jgi:electron transport complex protein RnfG